MEASTGVQEDAQGLEGLPVFKMVLWEQMMELITFYITFNLSLRHSVRYTETCVGQTVVPNLGVKTPHGVTR